MIHVAFMIGNIKLATLVANDEDDKATIEESKSKIRVVPAKKQGGGRDTLMKDEEVLGRVRGNKTSTTASVESCMLCGMCRPAY
jgi:hypothetical protein